MRNTYPLIKLGELCKLVRGPFGGSLKKSFFKSDGYAVYEQQHAINNQFYDIRYFIDEEKFDEMKRFEIFPGDLIMSCSGTMGKIAIVPSNIKRGIINQALLKISPKTKLDAYYLKYWLNSENFLSNISKYSKGAAIKNIASVKVLKEIAIPTPPLSEQKQIVALLDKAFAAIDQAKVNIEKNIENARELFQSKLDEVFGKNNDSWHSVRLKEITSKIGSGATPKGGQASYKQTGISLIRSMNVYDEGFSDKNLAFIDEMQAEKLKNVKVKKGDILLNITGASVARCCIVPEKYLPARVNQHVSIIRLKDEQINNRFLHYCLISSENKKKLLNIGEQGSTRQAITKTQIQNFKVNYPDILEQKKIVGDIDKIKEHSNKLISYYSNKIELLEELKKSILEKAFRGELTVFNRDLQEVFDAPDFLDEDLKDYNEGNEA